MGTKNMRVRARARKGEREVERSEEGGEEGGDSLRGREKAPFRNKQ